MAVVAGAPELGAVLVGLLEVVADDLVGALPRSSRPSEPVGVRDVQVGAAALGEEVVGRVAHQDVREPVAGLAGNSDRSGRISSRSTSAASAASTLRFWSTSARTAPRWKPRPSIDAASMTRRSRDRQRVDARGEERLDRRRRPHRPGRRRASRRAARGRAGFPRRRTSPPRAEPWPAAGRPGGRSRRAESVSDSGSSRTMLPRPPAAAHSGRRSSRSPRARQTIRIGARCGARRRARSGRASPARPSGCHRTRPPAGARRASASNSRRTAHWTSASVALAPLRPAAAATRDATTCGCESPARRPSISGVPVTPARSFTISISGQYVMPSP